MPGAARGGEGQQRHPRLLLQQLPATLRRSQGDVGELPGVGICIDGAIGEHQDAVTLHHQEEARRRGDTRRESHRQETGLDDPGGGGRGAGDHRFGVAGPQHQPGAKERPGRHSPRHPLAGPWSQLEIGRHRGVEPGGLVAAVGLVACARVIGAAQQERDRKVLLVQAVGGSDDPLVLALRENHAKLAAPDAAHCRL